MHTEYKSLDQADLILGAFPKSNYSRFSTVLFA